MSAKKYLQFLNETKTPYHLYFTILNDKKVKVVSNLDDLRPSNDLYLYKPTSSLVFLLHIPKNPQCKRMVATHSDSPCLKLKSNGIKILKEYCEKFNSTEVLSEQNNSNEHKETDLQYKNDLNMPNKLAIPVRTYGGGLFHTFHDRMLSLSGLVIIKRDNALLEVLVDDLLVAILPSLPPHLNFNQVYEKGRVKVDIDQALVLDLKNKNIQGRILQSHIYSKTENSNEVTDTEKPTIEFDISQIISHDLSFIDLQPAVEINGYVHSGRQDNLLSTFAGLKAIKNANNDGTSIKILLATDFEEIGSEKLEGAYSHLIRDLWKHLDQFTRNSNNGIDLILSLDVSHAYNPNFSGHFDPSHQIFFGESVTLKRSNSYATDPLGEAIMKSLCDEIKIKHSDYENRTGIRGGATIGTILSCLLGTRAVDIGTPTMAMHSARELSCWADVEAMIKVLSKFFNSSEMINQ